MLRWYRWRISIKKTDTKNKGVIHRYINENETETNWDTFNKETEELPDNTSPVVMEEYVIDEIDD